MERGSSGTSGWDRAQFDELLTRVGPRIRGWKQIGGAPSVQRNARTCLRPPPNRLSVLQLQGTYSIVLLAVVDARYRFRVVDVGAYGRRSDGGTLASSKFGKALQNGRLDLLKTGCCQKQSTWDANPMMIVENTFGILSAQWRMYRVIGTSPGNVEKCVKATCVLHNFIRWTAGAQQLRDRLLILLISSPSAEWEPTTPQGRPSM
ncbi:hypothetical protein AAFF_G00115100 [Aldrovandia affinis]|uniref:DDE Tnp4 domain-containing protein n=1 Tax=Aldrovandia affinis TaxID=143900 RepID=A0AAD7VXR8_9TELE|nr:hypothetical protein AAFF_G00115100 [Aldrovandia affinis]